MSGWSWIRVASVLGFLAVGVGAFGAHGLKARLDVFGTSATFQTGAHYHMVHALALLALGLIFRGGPASTAGNVAGWAFVGGVVVFSGSLYVLSVTGMKWLGAITPLGGLAFLAGWIALGFAARDLGTAVEGRAPRAPVSYATAPVEDVRQA